MAYSMIPLAEGQDGGTLADRLAAALAGVPGRLALAEALHRLGCPAEAAALYRLLLRDNPGEARALVGLGRLPEAPPGDPDPAALVATAEALARTAPPEEAEPAWRGVLALCPQDVTARMALGHLLRRGGRAAEAMTQFEAAARGAPDADWAAMALGDTLRELGRLADAEPIYRQLLRRQPGYHAALAALGETRRLLGDLAEARTLFARLLAAAPQHPGGLLGLAEISLAEGDAAAAAAGFQAVLAVAPDHLGGIMGCGYAAMALGDPATARPHFARAVAAAPRAVWARLALAAAERALGEHAAAAETYRSALAAEPGSVPARLGLIAALQDAGELAAALELARQAKRDTPAEPRFLLALGRCARLAGDREAARAAFRVAAEQLPEDPQPLVEAAVEERALDAPAKALALLQRALAIDPAHVPALEHIAAHHRMAGDHAAALASFEAGIATGRPGPWCYLGAAEILAEQGRMPAALALLEAGSRMLPAVPELPAKRLELLRRSGAVAEALALARGMPATRFAPWFERVVLEHQSGDPAAAAALLAAPSPPTSLAERARTEHLRGLVAADHWDLATAEAHLARASALAPDDPWPRARLAMVRLARFDLPGARAELAAQVRLDAAAARLQGRVARVSQTFHGQLLDDLALEPEVLARLAALAAQPAVARIAPLLGLVRDMPDHFGSAYALMIALRQSGGFTPAGGSAALPPIPPRLAQYWDGAVLPDDVAALMASWAERCPGFTITRFDDATALEWLRATQPLPVVAAWRRLRDATQRADLLRLAVLATEGGWWADADDRLFGSLAPLAPPGAALVLYQEDLGSIGNNLIGATPGHPVVVLALQLAVEGVNRGDADSVWLRTGPGLLTRALAMHLAAQPGMGLPPGMLVHGHLAMSRQVALHCLAAYKVTRHWMRPAQRVAPPREAARAEG